LVISSSQRYNIYLFIFHSCILIPAGVNMLLFPDALHTAHYVQFFCFKIEIKTKADSYMPCRAMAHSTKYIMSGRHLNPSVLTLFPEITQEDSIRTWCGNTVVAENVGYARHGKILSVVHSKSDNGKNHEDIMFEVQLDGQTSWILTDRSAGGHNSTSSPSPSNSCTDLAASSSSNAAYDRIVVPAFGKHDAILLWINNDPVTACSLEIRPNLSFSLANLAGLLPLVAAQAKKLQSFRKAMLLVRPGGL
jgi:hypothetical protein